MFNSINLQEVLEKQRDRKFTEENVLDFYQKIFLEVDKQRESTLNELKSTSKNAYNNFDINKVETNAIFHISDIKKLCADYRLRFLDTVFFKDEYPEEAITKIHELENLHNTTLSSFKIVAPIDVFKLRKADDPLLFAPMGNGYYYLIHKWGNDVNPFRKLRYWSVKNIENLLISMTLFIIICTALTYPFFIKREPDFGYLLMLFMFFFKGVVGCFFIFFGGSGKNFSEYSWQSQYDKIR